MLPHINKIVQDYELLPANKSGMGYDLRINNFSRRQNKKKNTRFLKQQIDKLMDEKTRQVKDFMKNAEVKDYKEEYWTKFRLFLTNQIGKEDWDKFLHEVTREMGSKDILVLHNLLIKSILFNARFRKKFALSFDEFSKGVGISSFRSIDPLPFDFGYKGYFRAPKKYGMLEASLPSPVYPDGVNTMTAKMKTIVQDHNLVLEKNCVMMMIRALEAYLKNIIHESLHLKNNREVPVESNDEGDYTTPAKIGKIGQCHSYNHYKDEIEDKETIDQSNVITSLDLLNAIKMNRQLMSGFEPFLAQHLREKILNSEWDCE